MIFARDRKVVDLIADLADTVRDCTRTASGAVTAYIEGNLTEAVESALQADALELESVRQMDAVLERLCQGPGLAPIRENLYLLAGSLQRIAAAAAACGLFFVDRRPPIPSVIKSEFTELAETSFSGYTELHNQALNAVKGSWHPAKCCEMVRKFEGAKKKLKKIRRDLYRCLSENGAKPMREPPPEVLLDRLAAVFEATAAAVDTVARVNLRLGA